MREDKTRWDFGKIEMHGQDSGHVRKFSADALVWDTLSGFMSDLGGNFLRLAREIWKQPALAGDIRRTTVRRDLLGRCREMQEGGL